MFEDDKDASEVHPAPKKAKKRFNSHKSQDKSNIEPPKKTIVQSKPSPQPTTTRVKVKTEILTPLNTDRQQISVTVESKERNTQARPELEENKTQTFQERLKEKAFGLRVPLNPHAESGDTASNNAALSVKVQQSPYAIPNSCNPFHYNYG